MMSSLGRPPRLPASTLCHRACLAPGGGVAFKQIGAVTPRIMDQTILPLVRKLQQKGQRTP